MSNQEFRESELSERPDPIQVGCSPPYLFLSQYAESRGCVVQLEVHPCNLDELIDDLRQAKARLLGQTDAEIKDE